MIPVVGSEKELSFPLSDTIIKQEALQESSKKSEYSHCEGTGLKPGFPGGKVCKRLRFIVTSNCPINPNYITKAILKFCIKGIKMPQIKRIAKLGSNYIRITFDQNSEKKTAMMILRELSDALGMDIRRQKYVKKTKASKNIVDEIKIITLNVNNLTLKVEEILHLISKENPDIVLLQETRRLSKSGKLYFPGYKVMEQLSDLETNRVGLCIIYRSTMCVSVCEIYTASNLQTVKIKVKDGYLLLSNTYIHGAGDLRRQAISKISELSKAKSQNLIDALVAGDWNTTPIELIRHMTKKAVNISVSNPLMAGTRYKATRKTTLRCIDFAVSLMNKAEYSQHLLSDYCISDHKAVCIKVSSSCIRENESALKFNKEKLTNPKNVKLIKEVIDLGIENQALSPDRIYDIFEEKRTDILKYTGIIHYEKPQQESFFLPQGLTECIKQKRLTHIKVRNGEISIQAYKLIEKILKNRVLAFRKQKSMQWIKKGIKNLARNDMRQAWKWLQQMKSPEKNKAPEPSFANIDQKLEEFAKHFESLSVPDTREAATNLPRMQLNASCQALADEDITWGEITKELKSSRKNKASSYDIIPMELYKLVENEETPTSNLAKSLLKLICETYKKGIIPKQWKESFVIPILKKGDINDCNNYRGIAIINTLAKLVCKIIASRVYSIAMEMKMISKEQAGFQKQEEAIGQAAALLEILQRRRNMEMTTAVCFMDFKKAYDLVPHKVLLNKLESLGINGKLLKFISSLYTGNTMAVKIGNRLSKKFEYKRGVRQGCPLSPVLFNIFINDLIPRISKIKVPKISDVGCLLFADDTVILSNNSKDLNLQLIKVEEWCNENGMEINIAKCGLMEVCPPEQSDIIPQEKVVYRGENVPITEKYVYLGVEMNNELDMIKMAQYRVQKGRSTLGSCMSTLKNSAIPISYKLMLIRNIIQPSIAYGSEIFGMNQVRTKALKKIADQALKAILKMGNFCRARVYDELSLVDISTMSNISRARAYKKWSESKTIIEELINCPATGTKHTWSKTAKIWLKKTHIPSDEINKRTMKKFCTDKVSLKDKSKITLLNTNLTLGNAAKIIKAEKNYKNNTIGTTTLIRLRTGTLYLTDRLCILKMIPESFKHKCFMCGANEIETTEHLILKCGAYKNERQTLMRENSVIKQLAEKKIINEAQLLGILLGGEYPSQLNIPKTLLESIIDFSYKICVLRAIKLAELCISDA